MSPFGKIVRGVCKVRCDGCGKISSDVETQSYRRADGTGWGQISSHGLYCEHDYCDECAASYEELLRAGICPRCVPRCPQQAK